MAFTLTRLVQYLAVASLAFEATSVSAVAVRSPTAPRRRDGPLVLKPRFAVPSGPDGRLMRRADGGECVSFTRPADATLPTTEVTPKTETTPPKTEDTPPKTEATPPATDATPPKTDTTKTDTAAADTKTATGDTTTTTAAVSAVAVTPAPGGVVLGGTKNVGSKMGLAWPNGEWTPEGEPGYLGNYIGTKTSWLYTWGPDPLKSAEAIGIEFVPMLWGPSDAHITAWHAAQATWPESTKNTLFFNEPNLFGTEVASGISAKDALPFWINDYLPVRTNLGMQLGGAGPTNGPDGLQWVLDFHDNCIAAGHPAADCTPDFAPVHFYISDLQQAKDYIQNFHDKTGLNVWVTEYACTDFSSYPAISPPYSDIVDYNQQLAAWMDEQAYVIRYAPFGTMAGTLHGVPGDNRLMGEDGAITELGKWYIG